MDFEKEAKYFAYGVMVSQNAEYCKLFKNTVAELEKIQLNYNSGVIDAAKWLINVPDVVGPTALYGLFPGEIIDVVSNVWRVKTALNHNIEGLESALNYLVSDSPQGIPLLLAYLVADYKNPNVVAAYPTILWTKLVKDGSTNKATWSKLDNLMKFVRSYGVENITASEKLNSEVLQSGPAFEENLFCIPESNK